MIDNSIMDNSKDKNLALITGSSSKLGREMAIYLAASGFDIAIHYNNSEDIATSLMNQIVKEYKVKAGIFQADLNDPEQAEILIPNINKKLGTINLLINNAANFANDNINNFSEVSFTNQMNLNLQAPIILTKNFAKQINSTGENNIINILDYFVGGNCYPKDFLSYSLSKTALFDFTRIMARNLAPKIRVNAIAPGIIMPHTSQDGQKIEKWIDNTYLKVKSNLQELRDSIKYLLEVKSMTGQVLFLDSGRHLGNFDYF